MAPNWYKSLQSNSTDGNVENANVLIRLYESEEGTEILIESMIKTTDSKFHWIGEKIIPQDYEQGLDIISKFDSASACNFIDRRIESEDIQF